jgi:hypothetical protein
MSKSFLDELRHFTIHDHDYEKLPKRYRKFLDTYRDLEFYNNGLKNGKQFSKVSEAKRLIKQLYKCNLKNRGKDCNIQGIIVYQLIELLNRMSLQEVLKLHLEKIVLP